MKCADLFSKRCLATFLAICLALSVPAAYAVVKNLSIVDGQGNSMPNTKVTIVFPDGSEVEEETDDDGMLYYNFPKDGDYVVKYPGGQMAVNVSGTGGGMSTGQMLGAGAAAVTIIGIGVVASDSGRKSSSDSSSRSSSSDPGSSTGGSSSGGSGSSSFDASVCNPATYSVTTSLSGSDPGNHASADSFDGIWEVTCPGGAGTAQADVRNQSGSGPNPDWSCTIGTGGDCFGNDAPCVWGGMSTTCTLDSMFSSSSPDWSGVLIIGFDGSLPPGDPVFFNLVGVRQ